MWTLKKGSPGADVIENGCLSFMKCLNRINHPLTPRKYAPETSTICDLLGIRCPSLPLWLPKSTIALVATRKLPVASALNVGFSLSCDGKTARKLIDRKGFRQLTTRMMRSEDI
jgi:hypothetical protein